MRNLAFLGTMGSGKTTFAELLVSNNNYTRMSFAKKVKEVAVDLFGMDPKHKDRDLLQGIGMKMRDVRGSVWVDYLVRQIGNGENIVVDDCRFINEVEALRKLGFVVIGLIPNEQRRLETLRKLYGEVTEEQLKDSSESQVLEAMKKVDYILMEHPSHSIAKNYKIIEEIMKTGRMP